MKRACFCNKNYVIVKTLLVLLLSVTFFACNYKSDAYKTLEQEKDSLLLEEKKKTAELKQMMAVMNLIEENFTKIREAENYVTFQTTQEQITEDGVDRIVQDIELISNTLAENKSQIANLKKQIAGSKTASLEMKRLVERLNAKIDDHAKTITSLQEQLALKDIRIQELDNLVMSLNDTVTVLKVNVAEKETKLAAQDEKLNKVWFVFGTRKELREQDIYTRNGLLEEGFNKDYFLEADARTLNEISLYSKKAKLLTNHPGSSYAFEKVDDFLVLRITNPDKFWEISHYLVIEVD
jgi:chromosome segregation ATPase